jgi:hypothetical protein
VDIDPDTYFPVLFTDLFFRMKKYLLPIFLLLALLIATGLAWAQGI